MASQSELIDAITVIQNHCRDTCCDECCLSYFGECGLTQEGFTPFCEWDYVLDRLKRKKMILWIKTTTDEYELPIAVATSRVNLAKMLGIKPETVSKNMSLHLKGWMKLEVDDDDGEEQMKGGAE